MEIRLTSTGDTEEKILGTRLGHKRELDNQIRNHKAVELKHKSHHKTEPKDLQNRSAELIQS